jgi:hypothetical protein
VRVKVRANNSFGINAGLALGFSTAALLGAQACGSGGTETTAGANTTGGNTGGTVSAGTISGGNGGSSGVGDSTGAISVGNGQGGGPIISPDAACAAETVSATITPVHLFIMFDRSKSMAFKAGQLMSKWQSAQDALIAFFQDSGSAGLRVALRFFPDPGNGGAGCGNGDCSISACSNPAVSYGTLLAVSGMSDPQETKLVSVVSNEMPSMDETAQGGSPLLPALQGASQRNIDNHIAHPGEKFVTVLVTDGEPNGCIPDKTNYTPLNDAAASALAKGVPTYVVGLAGYFETQMNALAKAGGTSQAFFLGKTNVKDDLIAALDAIKDVQFSCDFPMPTSTTGKPVDPALVNVDFTPKGGAKIPLYKVDNAAGCKAEGGWYYDSNIQPTKVILCPTSCTQAQSDADPKVSVLLGCMTNGPH